MKHSVPGDILSAFSGARRPVALGRKDLADLKAWETSKHPERTWALFSCIDVGWKKAGAGAPTPKAIALVDFSQLPADWFRPNEQYQQPVLSQLFEFFRAGLKRCKVKVSTYFVCGGYFELSFPKADLAKMEALAQLHRGFVGDGPRFLGAVPAAWADWSKVSVEKLDEIRATRPPASASTLGKRTAPKKPTAKPSKPAPASTPAVTATAPLPPRFVVAFDTHAGWWLRLNGDRLPYRANTKGVNFAKQGEVVGVDLRTTASPAAQAITRPPFFITDGASASIWLAKLINRCAACGSARLSLVSTGGGDQVPCHECGGMYALADFTALNPQRVTVEWAARLEGRWRPGEEDVVVEHRPALLSASGARAAAAASRIASRLELRAFSPGQDGDQAVLALGEQPRLRAVRLWYSTLTDRGLAALASYPTLEDVNAGNNRDGVTDDGARSLAKLSALRHVNLEQTAVGDAGLAALAKLPALETLRLAATRVTDAGLKALRGHPALRWLELGRNVSAQGRAHLATIPNLER